MARLTTCSWLLIATAGTLSTLGCGTTVPTAEVTGTITFDGQAQAGVLVEFTPQNFVNGKHAPAAYGITDTEGRYRAFRTGRNLFVLRSA